MIRRWLRLRAAGVLGLNARNREYVMRCNPRSRYPLVDDKLLTKRLALDAGIRVPELYGALHTQGDLALLDGIIGSHESFVIKPSKGSGGQGVVVITGRRRDLFVKPDGGALSRDDLRYEASEILSGIHSLGGQPDDAMIEYCIQPQPVFETLAHRGVPDIRVLVYRGVPAMAMVRLPTRASDGRANLHQGAIGAGIDLQDGVTRRAVYHDRNTDEHPDSGAPVAGVAIPGWHDLLLTAARCSDLVGLGYCGVDLVIDRERGPMMLELNARPGLAIQIANGTGLVRVLDAVDSLPRIPESAEERVGIARSLQAGIDGV